MSIATALVRAVLNGTPPSSDGMSCEFFEIGETGLKVYKSEKIARITHERQSKIAKMGYAPEVLSDVIEVDGAYVYFVEKIQTADSVLGIYDEQDGDCDDEIDALKNETNFYAMEDVVERYYPNAAADLHCGNWGVKDGRALCLDFFGHPLTEGFDWD